jgi:fatty-acyl-CoA synthase
MQRKTTNTIIWSPSVKTQQNEDVALRLGLSQALAHWAIYQATSPALICEDRAIAYADLDARANHYCGAIQKLPLVNSKRVAVILEEIDEFIAAVIGTIRAGGTVVLCQPHWPTHQIWQAFRDTSTSAIIANRLPPCPREYQDRAPSFVHAGSVRSEGFLHNPNLTRSVNSEWAVLFSSGTTNRPKGIIRNDLSVLSELIGWCLELSLTRTTRFYVGRPLYYTGGLVLTAATLLVGGTVITSQEHNPVSFLRLCEKEPPTYAFLIPSQIEELVEVAAKQSVSIPGTTLLSMGAFIEPRLKQAVVETLKCRLIESWGNSEGLGTIADPKDAHLRPASIGRPFLGDTLLVVDDSGNQLPRGMHGRIAGLADSRLSYYQDREDLNRCLLRGELVVSEDIGYQDHDGYFYLLGRATDFATHNGQIINLRDAERALWSNREISAACVVLLELAPNSTSVVAGVEVKSDCVADANELCRRANAILPESVRLDFVAVLHKMERNAAGKIVIERVRDILMEKYREMNSRTSES